MDVPVVIKNDFERRISDAFCIFDHRGDKCIDVREVGSVLRFIGCVPTEQEINDVITQTELDDVPGTIHLSKFMPYVANLITERKMEPATPEKLLEAFRVFDPDDNGYITKEYMSKVLTEEGEQFTQEELDEMLTIAVDNETGTIPYEYYLNQLMQSRKKKSVYELAQIELRKLPLDLSKKGGARGRKSVKR